MEIKIFTCVILGAACLLGALLLIWYPLRRESWQMFTKRCWFCIRKWSSSMRRESW